MGSTRGSSSQQECTDTQRPGTKKLLIKQYSCLELGGRNESVTHTPTPTPTHTHTIDRTLSD